jgi:hypothetical protein
MSFPSSFFNPSRVALFMLLRDGSCIMLAAVETTQDWLNATLGRRVRADIDNIFPY